MSRLLAILAICILSGGCAVGVTHEYDAADTTFDIKTESKVAVATHDQRFYIVDGDKEANFVGLSRGGYGNPFNVTTASEKPLADDFSASVVAALSASGTTGQAIDVSPDDQESQARAKLLAAKANRSIFLTINEWKADTYFNTKLTYNVLLRIFDANGNERADKQIQGEDNLGGHPVNPPGHSREVVPVAFREKLKELFGDPKIKAALQ
ncbi:MAG: hypothetical protein GKS00_13630 [Alphaproteobacteria bacterium]|nr:hypothetical protein [Alphaproteobacteria bacterium]